MNLKEFLITQLNEKIRLLDSQLNKDEFNNLFNLKYNIEKLLVKIVNLKKFDENERKKLDNNLLISKDELSYFSLNNILNLYPKLKPYVYTFGFDNCQEYYIAEKVCKVAKLKHHKYKHLQQAKSQDKKILLQIK